MISSDGFFLCRDSSHAAGPSGAFGSGAPHFANLAPVPLTGEYDAETETAVRVMQGVFGLPPTGVADCATWDMLAGLHNALYERAPLAWALP